MVKYRGIILLSKVLRRKYGNGRIDCYLEESSTSTTEATTVGFLRNTLNSSVRIAGFFKFLDQL